MAWTMKTVAKNCGEEMAKSACQIMDGSEGGVLIVSRGTAKDQDIAVVWKHGVLSGVLVPHENNSVVQSLSTSSILCFLHFLENLCQMLGREKAIRQSQNKECVQNQESFFQTIIISNHPFCCATQC